MTLEAPWLLGLDLGPRCSGALRFARFLRERLRMRVVGVFVSESWDFAPSEGTALAFALRSEAERWLAALNAGEPGAAVDATRIIDDVDAEAALSTAAREAAGVVVGRRAAAPDAWVRLGRVARRLLRRLPAPVIVVPPELANDEFDGPVMLATDLSDGSAAAARFAVTFARKLGRPLICVHVGQPRWDGSNGLLEPRREELRATYREATERATREWATRHCPDAALTHEYGEPVERLHALVGHARPGLLVLGSGRPGIVERIFAGSTASTVAAVAPCAVAVVPPDAP